jgi:hypothetical protein
VKRRSMHHCLPQRGRWLLVCAVLFTACARDKDRPRAPYVSLKEVENVFVPSGHCGQSPDVRSMGPGDRLGLFRDSAGTIWGLPLTIADDGSVLICAPSTLRNAPITDHYPAGATVIGAMNEPTGWRGSTGKLELLLREGQGKIG